MGECLMPRRGGGNSGGGVKTGIVDGTGAYYLSHDDFYGAKRVIIFYSVAQGWGVPTPGFLYYGDFWAAESEWDWASFTYTGDSITGEIMSIGGDTGDAFINGTNTLLSNYAFDSGVIYEYIAIY